MAGRPKTQAKKVREFEEWFLNFESGFSAVVPGMYLDRPDSNDQLNKAWNCAVDSIMLANSMLAGLGDMLRARAGIKEPGPSQQLLELGPDTEAQPNPSNNGSNGEQGPR